MIIGKILDLKQIRYDADRQALNIGLFAFDNLSVSYREVFGYGTPYEGKVAYAMLDNIDVVISEREGKTGGYTGRNAFGVNARVTEVTRVTKAIFDHAGEPGHADLLVNNGAPDNLLSSVSMSAEEAKRVKPTLSGAFLIYPKWPYVAAGTKRWAASMDYPEDTQQRITVVVADIACALLLDGRHKVIAAYEAR